MKERISISEAAGLMNVTPQFLRVCLQKKLFPFGFCVKLSDGSGRYSYYINKNQFEKYTGINPEKEEVNSND